MANKTFVNPFDVFTTTEKTVRIEALNADIKLRELTMAESDSFNKRLLKGYSGKGDPEINMEEATQINYEKVALCLIEPKMTVEQLQALPSSASKAINQIVKIIDGREDGPEEEEGNEN